MMFDQIMTLSKSVVQHGPNNDRIYLMKLHPDDQVNHMIDELYNLAILKRYAKIFVKVPKSRLQPFLDHEFKLEASVPGFYDGMEEGCFLGKYFNAKRGFVNKHVSTQMEEVIAISEQASIDFELRLPEGYTIRELSTSDASDLASIYRKVFNKYPFPVFEESYLLYTMNSNVRYFGVFNGGKLVAVSSAEMDVSASNAEMTDFATLPDYRGKGLSFFLLGKMIEAMRKCEIKTVYTIARALSIGMNKTFGKHGFIYGGTLINNTLIGDTIESMNVWYKNIA